MKEIISMLPDNPLLLLIPIILLIIALTKSPKKNNDLRYRKVNLMSHVERELYWSLLAHYDTYKSEDRHYRIFSKVRIADIITPDMKQKNNKTWWKAFSQISQKHFDFVLCDWRTLNVLYVIELNDKSHKRKDRRKRDIFVENACRDAGIPLVWLPIYPTYHKHLLDRLLSEADEVVERAAKEKGKR